MIEPLFFASKEAFLEFLSNWGGQDELWIGFQKVHTGIPSLHYPELVDVCLCLGWIDGKRMSIDENQWMIRITPRRPGSVWSQVNLKRYAELDSSGHVLDEGKAAFGVRTEEINPRQSYLSGELDLDADYLDAIKTNTAAWSYYQKLTKSRKATCVLWIMSARQESTRRRRLDQFIEYSAAGRMIPALQR